MSFIAQLAQARGQAIIARKAVKTAELHCRPLSEDLVAIFLENTPEAYAECLRKQADIAASLPALRAAVVEAEAALEPLNAKACYKCDGSGVYGGPTRAYRNGKPYCFACGGNGHK